MSILNSANAAPTNLPHRMAQSMLYFDVLYLGQSSKNGPSEICGRQLFKTYLVHS